MIFEDFIKNFCADSTIKYIYVIINHRIIRVTPHNIDDFIGYEIQFICVIEGDLFLDFDVIKNDNI